ncbi:MAG: ribose-phosphate pyrophosphokinase [Deltaproteobacteria bacterium]|nr:ribose-phosphate pyrophosphokinase [Deltaproteobacteria bacterium]
MPLRSIWVFSGNANLPLAQAICAYLEVPLGRSKLSRFSDGELFVEIGENVRGVDVFVVQPTCSPVNDHLMELLIMIDALKRASASSVTAVIPYYGYARQDRKVAPRTPITAKLVADLLSASGVSRLLAMDLHAGQIQGFFDVPFDHLYAMPALVDSLRPLVGDKTSTVMVSPDAGGVQRTRAYARRLGIDLAIVDKRRARANESEVMNIIGEVKGRSCILCDDMVDTAGTLCNAAKALHNAGASKVYACATHGVLSGPAVKRIQESDIEQVIVTDSIPLPEAARGNPKYVVVSVANLLAEAIKRIHLGDSVSSLFI